MTAGVPVRKHRFADNGTDKRHAGCNRLSSVKPRRLDVHSVLRESLVFGDFSVHGQVRMDNLLKVHS
jgi:hypothetical protein